MKINKFYIFANFQKILSPDNYLFILEGAATQFEPDSGDFLRVSKS